MATTLICGFETQSTAESNTTPAGSISTTVFRSGKASWRCNPVGTTVDIILAERASGGTSPLICQSARFYLRIDTMVDTDGTSIASNGGVTAGWKVLLNINGTVGIEGGTGSGLATSSLQLVAGDGVWHRFDVDASGANRTVYVDGVQWAQATGLATAAAQASFVVGITGAGASADLYYDDIALDDSSIGAPVSGANNVVLLLIPTAGTNAGGWTNGAGGTGDIHGSVANIPPVGVLASTAGAKIKNATSTITGDYVATMQSYSVAGVPAGSTVNAVQAICSHGEEVTTGNPKPGAIWVASNPAQTAGTGTFDYGDNAIEGTFPTGWPFRSSVVSVAPSVTLGSAPTVTIRKNLASTRVTGCCFMGLYVDYSPATSIDPPYFISQPTSHYAPTIVMV